ncbi:hypothetical protein L1987_60246 [Smallanthus sonchifolius]|uniref:Uncharacterized protein n=1 Tax=Smallanthus sonchifolius TaxID=185202 RepID=A0ACB9D7P3_9ASTR|nr:hypothetical protein L1987_60246 [Smallanthus sonchifolius]
MSWRLIDMESEDLGKGIQLLSGFEFNESEKQVFIWIEHSYQVDKMFETGSIKRLSEKVSKVVISVNLYKFNEMLFSTITDEMMANFNMFSFGMFHRDVCDGHGGIVVNEQWSSSEV